MGSNAQHNIWKSSHIEEDSALLQVAEIENVQPGKIDIEGKFFLKKGIGWICIAPLQKRGSHSWESEIKLHNNIQGIIDKC